jgi:hypothetical protein
LLLILASFVDTISDSTDAGECVVTISDSHDGAGLSLEREFSVAFISFSMDVGESVDTISDARDGAGSLRERDLSVASISV